MRNDRLKSSSTKFGLAQSNCRSESESFWSHKMTDIRPMAPVQNRGLLEDI